MTLIYTAKDAISAVVMGDALVTTRAEHSPGNSLTSHLRPVIHNPDRVITALVSKVCILRPNLAVAWTGAQVFCADVLRHWDDNLPDVPVFNDIKNVVSSYDARHDSGIVGAIFEPNEIHAFDYDVGRGSIRRGSQFIAGEGTAFFQDLITRFPYSFARRYRSLKKGDLGLGRLALWALHRLSDLPTMEVFGHDTLENWFGCGYDFVFSKGRRFYRISSIYQVGYQVTIDDGGLSRGFKLRPMDLILTQTYLDNGEILLRHIKTKFNRHLSNQGRHHADILVNR